MWGDPEKALSLRASDSLAAVLFQVCGPAHIPWQDSRWQELLHAYNIWIHVESRLPVLEQASASLVVHAGRSSNLAALCLHVTRLLSELLERPPQTETVIQAHGVSDFSYRIALVGKARATAGSLNLFRLLVHAIIQHSCTQPDPQAYLNQAFTYRSRDSNREHAVAGDLLEALMKYFVQLHERELLACSQSLPEVYDATTCSLQLLLVLFSSQLYSPMRSSLLQDPSCTDNAGRLYFWDLFLRLGRVQHQKQSSSQAFPAWTPRGLLSALLEWTIQRPAAPARSVQHHLQELCQSVAQATSHRLGEDGMYNTHLVVMAQAPEGNAPFASSSAAQLEALPYTYDAQHLVDTHRHGFLYDATKGVVMTLSSTILLLPLRLLSLAYNLFHPKDGKEHGYDKHYLEWRKQQQLRNEHLTRDVLWLTKSPIADLAACVILLLSNNERRQRDGESENGELNDNGSHIQTPSNPFRDELVRLTDNRWQADGNGLPDLPNLLNLESNHERRDQSGEFAVDAAQPLLSSTVDDDATSRLVSNASLSANYETLFRSFGQTVHTEVGALLLYTLLQASRSFADSIAVRSDLDTLVLPLLRTLYISSSSKHHAALDYSSTLDSQKQGQNKMQENDQTVSIRSCPFRSLSQLYVIVILLLLFSQDLSFGSDAFRRVMVANVPWYMERQIKDVSLGSILVLCLLRLLIFNLNRVHDAFLLSNCCAILMNLSASISELHEYAALRLAFVTLSSMKRYASLKAENPNVDEDDLSNLTTMHGEVCRTLLRVIKESFASKNIDRNLHLIYAMVYHQLEFKKLVSAKDSPFKKSEIDRILKVMVAASSVIEQANARTAAKALKVLSESMDEIRKVIVERKRQHDGEAFTFTYEEETDPETFFVPYVWEVIVCCATASAVEWRKPSIRVFPLLADPAVEVSLPPENPTPLPQTMGEYSNDLADVA